MFPGDELLPDARVEATHEIAIDAPPEKVWPWLVQMGRHRGGWYSWDLLDNGGVRSADCIVPEFQKLQVGDFLAMDAKGSVGAAVLVLDPPRAFVLGDPSLLPGRPKPEGNAPRATWAFSLEPLGNNRTRLVVRVRAEFAPSLTANLVCRFVAVLHAFMERKQLRSLKERAEAASEKRRRVDYALVSFFVLAFAISWTGALVTASRARALVFIAVLAGPSLASLVLTLALDGRRGLRDLARALSPRRIAARWFATLLVSPALLAAILGVLSLVSSAFVPGVSEAGAGSTAAVAAIGGLAAGTFEELGWTGFVTPRLLRGRSWLAAGAWLGVPWALWHVLPDYLHGARYGALWSVHMLEWVVALTAYRIFMTWVYGRTSSLLLGMLLHAGFTGSQLLLWPARASVHAELVWYGLFACALSGMVAAVVVRTGLVPSIAATPDERRRPMAGDAIVTDPFFVVTHAITIEQPPERVWPWLAQLGSNRGGWYSYDSIDNGGRRSSDRVRPDLQDIRPGDVLPALPGTTDAFVVAAVDPPRDLILTVPGPEGPIVSWEHAVMTVGPMRSRLVVRGRTARAWKAMARAAGRTGESPVLIERIYRVLGRLPDSWMRVLAAAGHRFMEARHMRGIKRRAESSA